MPPKLGILDSRGDLSTLLISARRATGRGCFVYASDGLAEPASVAAGGTVVVAGVFVLHIAGPG